MHSACVEGRADLVRYLLSKDADCYIENTKKENALMCVNNNPALLDIFLRHLLISYINPNARNLPRMTITQEKLTMLEAGLIYNCMWEWKPLHQTTWSVFSNKDSDQLNLSLINPSKLTSDLSFDLDINDQIYTISMMKFLQSGNNTHIHENQAWIRCRGSSYFNFNIVPIWQMMITKHPSITDKKHSMPELNILKIPRVVDMQHYRYQLNSWYYCDSAFAEAIDQAMDQRLRQKTIRMIFLKSDLIVNFETFSFVDQSSTIEGFIRWLPKFVTVDAQTKRMTAVNHFQAATLHKNPVVLTTILLKEAADAHQSRQSTFAVDEEEQLESFDEHDHGIQAEILDDENEEVHQLQPSTQSDGLAEEDSDIEQIDLDEIPDDVRPTTAGTSRQLAMNEITEKQRELEKMQANIKVQQQLVDEAQSKLNAKKTPANDEEKQLDFLLNVLQVEEKPSEELLTSRQECAQLQNRLNLRQIELDGYRKKQNQLEQELKDVRGKLENINRLEKLKTQALSELVLIEYRFVNKDYIPIQQNVLLNHLKSLKYPTKNDQKDSLISVEEINTMKKDRFQEWRVRAYPMHHEEMERIENRVEQLSSITQSQYDYHNRVCKRVVMNLVKKSVKPVEIRMNKSENWQIFADRLIQLINEECEKLCQHFLEHIRQKCKSIAELCIRNASDWEKYLSKETKSFIEKNPVLKSIEGMKQMAFEYFIEDAKSKSMQAIETGKIEKKSIDVRSK